MASADRGFCGPQLFGWQLEEPWTANRRSTLPGHFDATLAFQGVLHTFRSMGDFATAVRRGGERRGNPRHKVAISFFPVEFYGIRRAKKCSGVRPLLNFAGVLVWAQRRPLGRHVLA